MAEDSLDSKMFTSKGDNTLVGKTEHLFSRKAEYYKMDHQNRGTAIIFNHRNFKTSLGMNTRSGTDVDSANAKILFTKMGFKVKSYDNLQLKSLREKLRKVADSDHTDSDCFVCIVLTHGDDGILYAEDTKYNTHELWQPFLAHKCPSLAGKPKLFFIQACQGTQLDAGIQVYMTDSAQQIRFPSHADFLIAFSTVPGYFSWRNVNQGSWFIQALCKVMNEHYEKIDLLSILTIVNRTVAFDFESSCNDPNMHEKKQVPYITSMLTRNVFFGKQSN